MKIEANDKQVSDIFSLGYFKIPRFQRPYSWGNEEVNNFWDDVVLENHEHYFIGSMVVFDINKPYLGIVDGQQRLTTITLMLAAIRNAFNHYGEENLAKGVHNYIEKADIDNNNIFILDSETSFPYMQSHIQSFSQNINDEKVGKVGTEELKLQKGFEIINNKLNSMLPTSDIGQRDLFGNDEAIDTLKDIRNKVLSLKLVFIQLDNEEDAYLIFETLNTRGRDLTTPDLVKNILLKVLKNTQKKYDSPKLIWSEILQLFDDNGLDNGMKDFLYHYWLSKYKYTTEKKLFGKINKLISGESVARALLNDLKKNSDYYISVICPESTEWTKEEEIIKSSLLALKIFKVKQQIPMTLSLRRAYKEKKITLKQFYKTLLMMESFHFIFNAITHQRSSGHIHTFYSKHAIDLTNAESEAEIQAVISALQTSLIDKKPEFNEFEVGFFNLRFINRNTRNKKLIKYILTKFMLQNSTGVPVNMDAMTLEHLMPQSSSENEEQIGSIGNLILVDAKTNSEDLKDHSFIKKKEILLSKKYPLENFIAETTSWSNDSIIKRTELLCKTAYNSLWRVKT